MNTKKHVVSIVMLAFALFTGAAFGQTVTVPKATTPAIGSAVTLGVPSDITMMSGTSGTLAATNALAITSGGTFVTLADNWNWSGNLRSETRKDDGKGPTVQVVDASARLLSKAKLPTTRYRELAASIGLNPSPITDEVEVLQAIDELGMHVYDWDRVDQYLYRKALKQGANMRWVWKPLREADVKATGQRTTNHEHAGLVYPEQYAHAIPENVLARAADFIGKVPKAVLLVSDYEVINPDPFLAVTTEKLLAAGKIWIVERWDEPGYRDSAEAEAVMVTARSRPAR